LLYIFKKKEDSKIRISKCCKIYETKVSINLDRYYKYKYFYKEKIYKEINEVDELNRGC
jgi:hypothetical protein